MSKGWLLKIKISMVSVHHQLEEDRGRSRKDEWVTRRPAEDARRHEDYDQKNGWAVERIILNELSSA